MSSTDSPSIVPRWCVRSGDRCRPELDDFAPQVGFDLVRRKALYEQVELSGDQRIEAVLRPRGADLAERLRIGERVREGDLRFGATVLGLVARVDVRVPPRGIGGGLKGLQRRAAVGNEIGGRHLNQMRW